MKTLSGLFVLSGLALGGLVAAAPSPARAADAKIVLIAGKPSHGPGAHEFNAGTKLLAKCLKQMHGVDPVAVARGRPGAEGVFQGAKALVFFMDGGKGPPMIQGDRLETIRKLMDK